MCDVLLLAFWMVDGDFLEAIDELLTVSGGEKILMVLEESGFYVAFRHVLVLFTRLSTDVDVIAAGFLSTFNLQLISKRKLAINYVGSGQSSARNEVASVI
jgi:hypothetical protein